MVELINEAEILKTWSPIIESTTGIEDKEKLRWMSRYCHYHELYEDATNIVHLNPDMNVQGMGAVSMPGDPGLTTGFSTQAPGSGDKPYSLLPLAMQVAAQTIGLDLVPVVPMSGPLGLLTYLDFVYGGGRVDNKENPLYIKFDGYTVDTALVIDTDYFLRSDPAGSLGLGDYYKLTFVGNSRIDGFPIFRVKALDSSGAEISLGDKAQASLADVIAGSTPSLEDTAGGSGSQVDAGLGTAALVKALEDHITSFSGRGGRLGAPSSQEPYLREEGEEEPDNIMGLSLFNQSVTAQTYQVAAAVTREQVQDLKQFGIDAVAQVEAVLINELTQSINKHILQRIFRLGVTNHKQVFDKDGTQFNLVFDITGGTATVNIGEGEDGAGPNNITAVPKIDTTTLTGGETQGSLQRRILSKILASANIIAIRGRRGAANFAVTNGQVASALQDIAGFTPYPLSNTINQSAGSLYPVGSIAGVNVYVDPNMSWGDTRVAIGRKGDGNSPGLVFMPYLMAESVQAIAEGTMAPKIAVKSRYALVDAGHHPQTNYITFKVELLGGTTVV